MNMIQREQEEYDKFIFELTNKIRELQNDLDKLSLENQSKVKNELKNAVVIRGLSDILEDM